MPLPFWVCCCGGEVTDCCDWWTSCPVATPTTITITFTYEKVRYYSNGQRLPLEYETWSVQSANAISRKGLVCYDPLGYDDGCTQAKYTYESGSISYAWNDYLDSTIDGTHGTISGSGANCTGCIFRGYGTTPLCQANLLACEYRRDKYSYTGTLTGGSNSPINCAFGRSDGDIIKYGCTTKCGCVQPFIQFRPSTNSVTGTFTSYSTCCNDDPSVDPTPATIGVPSFTLTGKCGCPDTSTWDDPKFGCDGCPYASPFDYCAATCGCKSVKQVNTLTTGTDTHSWLCLNYTPDNQNPIIVVCEKNIDWVEKCETTISVEVV